MVDFYTYVPEDLFNVNNPCNMKNVVKYFNCTVFNFEDLCSYIIESNSLKAVDAATAAYSDEYNNVYSYFLCLCSYLHAQKLFIFEKSIKGVFSVKFDSTKKAFEVKQEESDSTSYKFYITRDLINAFYFFILHDDDSILNSIIHDMRITDLTSQIKHSESLVDKYEKLYNNAKNNLLKLKSEYEDLTTHSA